jgi:hypothetical protein
MKTMVTSISPAEINDRNKQFWTSETAKAERRMADPGILHLAVRDLESYAKLFLPIYHQKSFEQALEDADCSINNAIISSALQRRFSRRGGLARKSDALQVLILEIVTNTPSITEPELITELQARQSGGIIEDVSDGSIWFTSHSGHSKMASLSGLKDRLSRAKKAIRSR